MAGLRGLATAIAALSWIGLPARVAAGGESKHAPLLTEGNFDEHLAKERKLKRKCLVMFHVSWCKVCQRTFPEFVSASEKVYERQIEMDFAHVDCTNEKALCSRFNVKGYPTIKLFLAEEGVEPRSFKIQRSEASFIKYAERMTMPAVREFSDAQHLEKEIRNETLSAFIVAAPSSKAVPTAFAEAANTWMDRHIFAVTRNLQDLLPKGVVSPEGAKIAVLSLGPQQQWAGHDNTSQSPPAVAFYSGSFDASAEITSWVERNRFPGVWNLSEANFYEFTHASRRTALLADDPARVTKATEVAFRGAAAELPDDFIFGVVNGAVWDQELADFNIYQKDLPRILVTEENFEVWMEDIEELRPAEAAADLRRLASGAPLLRQTRKTWSKIFFWHREAGRLARRMGAYAEQGTLQAFSVAVGLLFAIMLMLLVCWGLIKLCGILLTDPDDDEYAKVIASMKQKSS